MSASNASLGLMFSISPAKKQEKKYDKDEEKYMLLLAPFNKAPRINFGQVKPHEIVEKSLLVVNPQDFTLKLNIKNTDLNINNIEVEIERQANIDFRIKWQPEKAESYKFSIIFEVSNSRLKFIVHAFGVCVEPPKKKVFKNLTILQPIRPILQPQRQQQKTIEGTLKSKPKSPPKQKTNNKENNNNNTKNTKTTTVITKRSVIKTEKHFETTYIVENSVENFEKILQHVKINSTEPQEPDPTERRQTEILKTPKLASRFNFDFNEPSLGSYNQLETIYSASVSNLNAAANYPQTPIFKEPLLKLRRSISATNLNPTPQYQHQYQHFDDLDLPTTPKLKLDFEFNEYDHTRQLESANELREIFLMDIRRKYAALKIQYAFKAFKKRRFEKKYAIIRRKNAAIKIQRQYRNYQIRSKAACVIQKYIRKYLNNLKQNRAVNTIKRYWYAYKFRKSMRHYRNAVVIIQKWTRSMSERYKLIRFKRVVIFIQQQYKRKYMVRVMAALKIQLFYRSYKYRMNERYRENYRLNYAATLIQSLWRGYRTRKEINLVQLNNIRERLSIYIQRPHLTSHMTLGFRIKRSLNVLEQKSPSIQQIITALMDLQVVTRLSKECCVQFANAGAISILYGFISRCNRSTPHMDLIKLCLEILINLSKCEHTCELVVNLDHRLNEGNVEIVCSNALNMLIGLLQAYQSSNAQIFLNVCVLLVILGSNEKLVVLRGVVLQQFYLKKLMQLYTTLERRTNFRSKNQRLSIMQPVTNTQDLLNDTANSSMSVATSSTCTATSTAGNAANGFNQANFMFTLEPDWSLSKKLYIQLTDPLGALHYLLLSCLKVKIESSVECGSYKTPKKGIAVSNATSSVKKVKPSATNSIENLSHVDVKASSAKSLNGNKVVVASRQAASLKTIYSASKSIQTPVGVGPKQAKFQSKVDVNNKGKCSNSLSMDSLKENEEKKTITASKKVNLASGSTIRKKLI
jgi:hypothetical protein